jgi:hypothetical protein
MREVHVPRYFFNIRNPYGDMVCRDVQGTECADKKAARAKACCGAGFIRTGPAGPRSSFAHHRFEVTDAAGKVLFTVPFSKIVPSM